MRGLPPARLIASLYPVLLAILAAMPAREVQP
jgi:hypothetical protein